MQAADRIDGQWIGEVFGPEPGVAVVELERDGPFAVGTAYLYPKDPEVVPVAVQLALSLPLTSHQLKKIPVVTFSTKQGLVFPHEQLPSHYLNSFASKWADVTLNFQGDQLSASFQTEITNGWGTLHKGNTGESKLISNRLSWKDFRAATLMDPGGRYVFRGQAAPWKLRTSFHRSPRKILQRYQNELVPEAYRTLAPQLARAYDLEQAKDAASFYDLLQHHGYPTPLLDWTKSPFVAAYFAFEQVTPTPDTFVRIYAFDRKTWLSLQQSDFVVAFNSLHLSFQDIAAVANPRAGPQQSVFTLTNIDDIEWWLILAEHRMGVQLLTAIDIPTSERDIALRDLGQMNIHHGSLFPGLDGSCRSLRHQHFSF